MESPVNLTDLPRSRDLEFGQDKACNMCWLVGDAVLLPIIILGNVFTILAVQLSRQLRHVSSNQLILSLAISDLIVGLAVFYHSFFFISESLAANKHACLLRFTLMVGACYASFFNVTAIALDRYIAIVHPLKHPKYMTGRTVWFVVAFNWSNAIVVSLVPFFWNVYEADHGCELNTVIPRLYLMLVLVPLFLTVWLSIVVIYLRIWHEARVHARRSQEICQGSLDASTRKSNQVVLMILGCFSLCWLPYVAVVIAQVLSFPRRPGPIVYHAMFWLAMCNSAANPLIYAWKNPGFRRAFQQLLKLQLPKRPDYNSSFKRYLQRHAELEQREREREARNEFRPAVVLKTVSAEMDKRARATAL